MANEFVVRNGLRVPSIPNGCYLSSVNGTIVGCTVPAPVVVQGTGTNSTLRCGVNSTASGNYSTVLGRCNTATGDYSTVFGYCSSVGQAQPDNFKGLRYLGSATLSGYGNTVSVYGSNLPAPCSFPSQFNVDNSLIAGGRFNQVSGFSRASFIAGGEFNNIASYCPSLCCQSGHSSIGGGYLNSNLGCQAVIAGGWGNNINIAYDPSPTPVDNPMCWSVIGGGLFNAITRCYGTIAGGGCNYIYGNAATIAGGFCNIVCCGTGFIGGGRNSTMSGRYATLGGGRNHTISGYGAAVLGGCLHTASSSWTSIGGGVNNTASADFATISGGFRGVADKYAQRSHASGRFAVNGDSQQVDLVGRTKTTNNTPTNIWLDGTSVRLTVASGKALFAVVNVAGIKSDGSAAAHYIRKVAIKNVGGTTSLIGTVSTIGTDVEDNVNYDVTITADDTTDSLDIKVTGETAETLRWTSHIEGVEIAYGT